MMTSSSMGSQRLGSLDGWRAISVLLVLSAHLLPMGPKSWNMNITFGGMGMAIFFTLSGFLITRFLLENQNIKDFLIRRFFRIVPLAWLAVMISFILDASSDKSIAANILFYANLPPQQLTAAGSHLWSLCVEIQFYLFIALIVLMFGRRGLYLLTAFCLCVTLYRVDATAYMDIVTSRRADEILAGGILALVYSSRNGGRLSMLSSVMFTYILAALLVISSHPAAGAANYLRPYIAAALVGSTLLQGPTHITKLLNNRIVSYIAQISFALYIIHHLLIFSWFGDGAGLEKYLKRPLLIALTFILAHLSTFYFERRFIALGKRLTN